MKTVLTTSPIEAAKFIRKGGIVAFPTETVYGLGANVFDAKAIAKIFAAKQRPNDNPLIAHVGNLEQINLLVSEITEMARKFIKAFFPAALTLVLPKAANVPLVATAKLETIGVRMPNHALALQFLLHCEMPVVAPSSNLSGRPSPTTWQAVFEDLDGRIDCILQGEATEIGLESTVVDCTSKTPQILRAGAVTLKQLRKIIPQTKLYRARKDELPKSPGLRHRHYSPHAKVILVNPKSKIQNPKSSAFIGLELPKESFNSVKICATNKEYAHEIFNFFRECDHQNIEFIFCQTVKESGIGLALMDRLRRAAE